MKIHKIDPPRTLDYSYSEPSEFSEWHFEEIPSAVAEAWYWYVTGSYDGDGQLLMRTEDGLYHLHDCGHCSCYGPTDRISLSEGKSLDELVESCTGEVQGRIEALVEAARQGSGGNDGS